MKYFTPNYYFRTFKSINQTYPKIRTILIVLLLIDLFFILLHAYSLTLPLTPATQNLRLDMDLGYAEIFQYVQYICAAILLVISYSRSKIRVYLVWAMFFIFLFIDDAFAFHEIFGGKFVQYFEISGFAGLTAQDLGELAMAALLGLIFVFPILLVFFKGRKKAQEVSVHFIVLVGILIVFGVGMDMMHSLLKTLPGSGLLTVIEDAGEMMAGSLLVWYSMYLFAERDKETIEHQ